MVLTPGEAFNNRDEEVKALVVSLEKSIDAKLRREYVGNRVYFDVPGKYEYHVRMKVVAEIKKMYEKSGWRVTEHDCQLEGYKLGFVGSNAVHYSEW